MGISDENLRDKSGDGGMGNKEHADILNGNVNSLELTQSHPCHTTTKNIAA